MRTAINGRIGYSTGKRVRPILPPARACFLESGSRENARNECAAGQWKLGGARRMGRAVLALLALAFLFAAIPAWAGQAESLEPSLPDAPQPQAPTHAGRPAAVPCPA